MNTGPRKQRILLPRTPQKGNLSPAGQETGAKARGGEEVSGDMVKQCFPEQDTALWAHNIFSGQESQPVSQGVILMYHGKGVIQ